MNDKKRTRLLKWNCLLLGIVAATLIASIISVMCNLTGWWFPFIALVNLPMPIINIINLRRIERGEKPF